MKKVGRNGAVSIRMRGFTMVLVAALLWGVTGAVAQSLLQHYHFTTEWLVSARLLISGAALILMSLASEKRQNVWNIIRSGADFGRLLIFAIFGLLAVQYTYFVAVELGNAATATLLQYLGPVFLTAYIVLRNRQLPSVAQMLALFLALLGTFFLITNGNPVNLSISTGAVVWGLISAVTLAFYTLYPKGLLERWGATVVLGWGMLIGGITLILSSQPWQATGQIWTLQSVLTIGFLVVFGTLIAFYLYLDSMRFILPSEASILLSAEPLSAVVATVVWLQVPFGMYEWLGAFCIVCTVFALANHKEKKIEVVREQHI
jgi:drug/metabolite transporter (DMT)-like permease